MRNACIKYIISFAETKHLKLKNEQKKESMLI